MAENPIKTCVFSLDVECDGRTPVDNNCRELAVVVIDPTKVDPTSETKTKEAIVAKWYWLIEPDSKKGPQKETMDWLATQPQVLARWNDPATPRVPMHVALAELREKVAAFGKIRKRWIAAPASFDWAFLEDRLGFRCECLSTMHTMACSVLSSLFETRVTEDDLFKAINPWSWPHTHHPIDDAMHQGLEYCLLKQVNWRTATYADGVLRLFNQRA